MKQVVPVEINLTVILILLIHMLAKEVEKRAQKSKEGRRKHPKRKQIWRRKKLSLEVKEEERKKIFNHSKLYKNKDNN